MRKTPMTTTTEETRGRKPKYDWDSLMVPGQLILVRGKNFSCQPHGMAVMVRKEAAARDLAASIKIEGDVLIINLSSQE
jgi:hypothetical protein